MLQTYDAEGQLINIFDWRGLVDLDADLQQTFRVCADRPLHRTLHSILQVPNLKTGRMEPLISALTAEEEEQFKGLQ